MALRAYSFLFVLALTACDDKPAPALQPPASCSAQVTDGNGRFWAVASASAGSPRKPLKRRALKDACEVMCEQRKASKPKACVARCMVDAGTDKIGVRMTCHGAAP